MSKIREIVKNFFRFNMDYIPVQINDILSNKERDKLKKIFDLSFNIIIGISVGIFFLVTLIFYYCAFFSESLFYYNFVSLFSSVLLCLTYYKLELYEDCDTMNNAVAFLSFIFLPISIIIFFTSSLIMMNLSKKIFIFKKEHLGIITKINLNLQEFYYKDGKLHSYGNRPAVRKKLKNMKGVSIRDSYEGDIFYYKGCKWEIRRKNNDKYSELDEKEFDKFKKNIDLKSKIGNF
jgi:hypothetical protein